MNIVDALHINPIMCNSFILKSNIFHQDHKVKWDQHISTKCLSCVEKEHGKEKETGKTLAKSLERDCFGLQWENQSIL